MTHNLAPHLLRQYIERMENLAEEKRGITDDERAVLAEAKGNGYDPKIIRRVLKIRKQTPQEREEETETLNLYCKALGIQLELPGF
jgi:uncharacterized protein (UPF0335 family)